VEFSKEMGRRKIKEIGCSSKGVYATLMSDIPELYAIWLITITGGNGDDKIS